MHNYYDVNSVWNVATHGVAAIIALVVVYIFRPTQFADKIQKYLYWLYGTSLSGVLLASTVYHGCYQVGISNTENEALRIIDHCSIFWHICCAQMAVLYASLSKRLKLPAILIIFLICVAGIVFKIGCPYRYHDLCWVWYVIMGWYGTLFIVPVMNRLEFRGMILIILGGYSYTYGVVIFHNHDFLTWYFHPLWHISVNVGATLHFLAIYWYVFDYRKNDQ